MGFQHLSSRHLREISRKGNQGLVASGQKHIFSSDEAKRARAKGIQNRKDREERRRIEYLRANGTLPPKK
jgi:hypothetical protein